MLASSAPSVIANPVTNSGSYRREIGQVSFLKMRSIEKFLKAAFGDEIGKIFNDTAGGYIYALSDVRNCIAHSAGKVDGAFLAKAKKFPEFANLNIRDKLLLDGDLVRKLRNSAGLTGAALLKAVDEMLVRGD